MSAFVRAFVRTPPLRVLRVLLITLLVAAVHPAGTRAQTDDPERVRAIALKAADLIAARGLEAAAAVFNRDGEFRHEALYVTVIDFAGVWKVYPPRPAGVGMSVINVKDPDGRDIVRDILSVARDAGEGWVEYRWLNPASNRIEPKTTFVKRVPGQDLVAYVGLYH
ncbi:signal transduction histidine kinase [Azospirillum sp. OGB3]|uniref:cache domain-containing protein n=1 Tax=Azospirillum sp. OGB3 TaxID=2587012 RepID=UPI00160664BC|nr:cache domain-containing protein [Azospirillum sp. OGB3]MBB3263257.1 signal transduction histidine kinase [Azospirillum sp. OGB3]